MSAPALLAVEAARVETRAPSAGLRLTPARLAILEDVSLEVAVGETLGLVGESGSGKTTLAKAMTALTPLAAGRVRYAGGPITEAETLGRLRRECAIMFQDAVASLSPRRTVWASVAEPLIVHRRASARPRADAERLLARVGLGAELLDRYPHQLSGGQARRVGVARALALEPRLVIADEPVAGLDVSVQGEILNLLARLRAEQGLALVVVTHNLAVIRRFAERLAILFLGRLVETGPTAEVFARPAHPYSALLIGSEPHPDPRARRARPTLPVEGPSGGEPPSLLRRPSGCAFHPLCPRARAICRELAPPETRLAPGRSVRCHHPLP